MSDPHAPFDHPRTPPGGLSERPRGLYEPREPVRGHAAPPPVAYPPVTAFQQGPAYDPYRPYETDPYARPRPAPKRGGAGATVLGFLVPTVVAAAVATQALIQQPALGLDPDPATPAPGASASPTPTPSPTPTGPQAPQAARPEVDDLGKTNPLYAVTMPPKTTCDGFRAKTGTLKSTELHGYLDGMLTCLMTIHGEPLKARGIEVRRPALRSEDDLGRSTCRQDEEMDSWAGLYCASDNTIYYRKDTAKYSALEHQLVMTHEFSHHLQREAGIVSPYEQRDGDEEANLLLERRIELQATCMSGAMLAGAWSPLKIPKAQWNQFLDSMDDSIPPEWQRTHGTGAAQARWTKASTGSATAYQGCNTWAAVPADVK
ncbi:neutral zinc metallopeptidase [Mariniluteicoccus flavus]